MYLLPVCNYLLLTAMLPVYLNQEILVRQTKTVLTFFTLGQSMSCLVSMVHTVSIHS